MRTVSKMGKNCFIETSCGTGRNRSWHIALQEASEPARPMSSELSGSMWGGGLSLWDKTSKIEEERGMLMNVKWCYNEPN